ncbi:hypothetical protein PG989_015588 [Apiospora arundinis]
MAAPIANEACRVPLLPQGSLPGSVEASPGQMVLGHSPRGINTSGGHSALSSLYGMAADQALEWEVVDGTGNVLRATPSSHPDLYWALSGGGGGIYGIVSSVVVKLLPDVTAAGVQLKFRAKDPAKLEGFPPGRPHVPSARSRHHGGQGHGHCRSDQRHLLSNTTHPPRFAQRHPPEPCWHHLSRSLRSKASPTVSTSPEHPNRLQYWQQLITPNPTQLVQNAQYGGWFLPKEVVVEQADALQWAVRETRDVGCAFVGLALNLNVSQTSMTTPQNSILPSWREASLRVTSSTYVHHCPFWPANGAS